ncbi:hypothetical protein [Magnetospirillum sp. UT-4]|uniref:hypothetical protein n=1 Tax=Magnetospirillum sp. UT-4 TaxID=2681467 RepID=UPI001574C15F|nr:hypothetical protein [Magnetospirillum sp. UT-4]
MSGTVVNLVARRKRLVGEACLRLDWASAFRLALPLALDGEPKAQAILGALYFLGVGGCAVDRIEAWAWLYRSERGGNASAHELLELVEAGLSADELSAALQRALSITLSVQSRYWALAYQRSQSD